VDNGVVVASIVATGEGRAKLTLGNEARGAVMAGTGNSGNGYIVVHGKDGKPAIDMGTENGRPMGVYVLGADGVRVQAGLGIDEAQRGILRIGEPAGLRGTLGFTKSGNGISFGLFDKPGPDARVALYAAADGSSLQLKSPSGGIDLNTDGTGSLLGLSNVKGSAAVALEMRTSGAGRVTIGDAAGNTVVEAGVTIEGLGVVRAGPDLGGTTGAMSGGLVVPRAILGRRAK
jgi:hypothetical protein